MSSHTSERGRGDRGRGGGDRGRGGSERGRGDRGRGGSERGGSRGRGRGEFTLPSHSRGRGRGDGPAGSRGSSGDRGESHSGESSRSGSRRTGSSRVGSSRGESSRGESSRGESSRGESGRGESGRGTSSRGDSSRGTGTSSGRGRSDAEIYVPDNGGPSRPDLRVTRIENEVETAAKAAKNKLAAMKKASDSHLPHRPGFGTQGIAIFLFANYLDMNTIGDPLLYRYAIDILPDQSGKKPAGKRLRRIIQLMIEEHLPQNGHNIATDFKANLISKSDIDVDENGYEIVYRAEGDDEAGPNAKRYRAKLIYTGTLTISELLHYLNSTQAGTLFGSKEEIIQALNIVVGHWPKNTPGISTVGANKHFRLATSQSEKYDLGAGFQAIRGFFVSVRAATARILVNLQVKPAAFYNEGPLDRLMLEYMRENGQGKVKLGNFLKKLSVSPTHITRRNRKGEIVRRIKTIQGLAMRDDGRGLEHPPIVSDFGAGPKDVQFYMGDQDNGASGQAGPSGEPSKEQQGSPSSPKASQKAESGSRSKGKKKATKAGPDPPPSEGRYISVYDFFRETYNIAIKDTSLPVVNVGTRQNPMYLPAQVCEVVPGQHANAKLSAAQTQRMIRFAVRPPNQNAQSIVTSGVELLGFEPTNPTIGGFGLSVTPKLVVVPARVLRGPEVRYAGNKVANTRFGSWNMQSIQFSGRSELPYWTYLQISFPGQGNPNQPDGQLMAALDAFTAKMREVGVNADNVTPGLRITVTSGRVETDIDSAINRFTNNPNRPPPKLLLVVLPVIDSVIYNRIKYACDIKFGLLNVCVVRQKFVKPHNDQYFANVALKINLKLGGRNQFLDDSRLGVLAEGKTMLVGVDVTHPAPGSSSAAPSVAGVVASIDRWFAQWPAELQIQPPRQEMVPGLNSLLISRLALWRKHNNGNLPENILVYRDGVSEGEFNRVLDQELPALRQACEETYPATLTKQGFPRLTVIIVGKAHNTRFYPTRKQDADRSANPQNGTIVDRGVTEARNWDFFLQSHTALQGTARPAYYYIVHDEIFQVRRVQAPFQNAADALEDLTHNLCYLFGRATKAVSFCPPAYYADLSCERARRYLTGVFDPSPLPTPAGSVAGEEGPRPVDASQVRIHERVRDSMFYI